jgi:phosphoribosylamine--glycine ligase
MKVLVVGSGGREHALVWRLARSGHVVLAAPGNPGMVDHATCIAVPVTDLAALCRAAVDHAVDLVVIGPEAPLCAGLADRLREHGVAVFGPSQQAAQLEGSKIFAKRFFNRHGIRSAEFTECEGVAEADRAIDRLGGDVVVKADGLASGKGVVVCGSSTEARQAARDMLEAKRFGAAGDRIVIERRLRGRELSIMAITDGQRYEVLEQAEDHKAVFDGDRGPNTGGMGAVSPARWASAALLERVRVDILDPTLRGLAVDGLDYRGVLYAGIMVDGAGVPWILEYNCRFGDPETEPVLARMGGDLAEWLAGAAAGRLPGAKIPWDPRTAVCVFLTAAGYPEAPRVGDVIEGVDRAGVGNEAIIFHAGTARRGAALVTAGGRVLAVTALGESAAAARERAYAAVTQIRFDGMHYRRDIGARGEEAL